MRCRELPGGRHGRSPQLPHHLGLRCRRPGDCGSGCAAQPLSSPETLSGHCCKFRFGPEGAVEAHRSGFRHARPRNRGQLRESRTNPLIPLRGADDFLRTTVGSVLVTWRWDTRESRQNARIEFLGRTPVSRGIDKDRMPQRRSEVDPWEMWRKARRHLDISQA